MLGFLKVFGKGVLYTVLLPFILLILAIFTVFCVILFVIMLLKSILVWIRGGDPFEDTDEDIKAKRILLEKQEQANNPTADQYKDALIATLASAVAQQSQRPINNTPAVDVFPTNEIEHSEPSQLESYLDQGDEHK